MKVKDTCSYCSHKAVRLCQICGKPICRTHSKGETCAVTVEKQYNTYRLGLAAFSKPRYRKEYRHAAR